MPQEPSTEIRYDEKYPDVRVDARGWPILLPSAPFGSAWERHDDVRPPR